MTSYSTSSAFQHTRSAHSATAVCARLLSCVLALMCATGPAHAFEFTWDGGGDGHSWTDCRNWSFYGWADPPLFIYPGFNSLLGLCYDDAVIPANAHADLTSSISIGSLTIGSGGSLTVLSGRTLRLAYATGSGSLINQGTIAPCIGGATFDLNLGLVDALGAVWTADSNGDLTFTRSHETLFGDFFVTDTNSRIILGGEVWLVTEGSFSAPTAQPICYYVEATGDDAVFSWWNHYVPVGGFCLP